MFLIIYLSIMLLAAFCLLFALCSMVFGFWRTGVPFVGSKLKDAREILLASGLKDGQVFFDLGSGDGRVVLAAAELVSMEATGFELALWPLLLSRVRKFLRGKRLGKSHVHFLRLDFLQVPWKDVDVLFCYLSPHVMKDVAKKFALECKPGTVLVANSFELSEFIPAREVVLSKGKGFIYIKN